jgi:hypothetical protein
LAVPFADSQGVDAEEEEEADPDPDRPHSLETFRLLCGDADADALKGFLSRVSEDDNSNVSPIILSPDADKAHRSVGLIFPTLWLYWKLGYEVVISHTCSTFSRRCMTSSRGTSSSWPRIP